MPAPRENGRGGKPDGLDELPALMACRCGLLQAIQSGIGREYGAYGLEGFLETRSMMA